MSTSRSLTTYLVLAAMLVSNAAGWVHVGCCDNHPSEPSAVVSSHESAAPVSEASASASITSASSCDCQHHCKRRVRLAGQHPVSQPSSKPAQGDGPSPPPEHDSDSCNICQNFYTSRYAITEIAAATVWSPAITSRVRFQRDFIAVEPVFFRGLSVRGPPSV